MVDFNKLLREPWTQVDAIDLCAKIEEIAPNYGAHVALTGGCLYKTGPRKDCDILFYRIRRVDLINQRGLFQRLEKDLGIKVIRGFGWVFKAMTKDEKPIDFFFPEEKKGSRQFYMGPKPTKAQRARPYP